MEEKKDYWKKHTETLRDPKEKRHFLVGPPDKWKEAREIQIKFLKENGLKSKYYLLDLGCGTLRGGMPFYSLSINSLTLPNAVEFEKLLRVFATFSKNSLKLFLNNFCINLKVCLIPTFQK